MRRASVLWIAALVAGALVVGFVIRIRPHSAGHRQVPPVIAEVRFQLALVPVLAAEAELRRRPDDSRLRLRLAQACAGTGDPTGAALALAPLLERSPTPDLATQYAGYCLEIGWLDEAAAALRRVPAVPARFRLQLAAAYAGHGQANRAVTLLKELAREGLAADEWLEGAVTAYQCRRREQAVEWAQRGMLRQPESLAARSVLARCLLATGQSEAAVQILTLPPGASPDPMIAYWRARAEVNCPDPRQRKAGRTQLARWAAENPDNIEAAFAAGRAFCRAGQAGRAVPLLSRAAVGRYQEVVCYELLSRAYTALGRPAEAAWAWARSRSGRGQYGEACAALHRSLSLNPRKPLAYVDLAQALQAQGRSQEAVAVLDRAQKIAPNTLDVRLLKARLLLHLERPEDVARELTAAAALDPGRANEPLGNLGTVYYDSQQFDRAQPVLEQAVKVEDGDAHSHFYLGRTYARRIEEPERAQQAIHHLLRAAQIQPDYARPWVTAAAVLQRLDYLPEAAACLRRAISGDSQSDAPYLSLAQILQLQGRLPERGLVLKRYAATRDHDLKRTGLEKETRENPQDAPRRFALGELLLREGRPQQALPELLAATGLRPHWNAAWSRLADVCALLGYDDLREEAERAAHK